MLRWCQDEPLKRNRTLTRCVIFITGDVATPETLAFLHNPPKRWLEKPFDLTELRKAIAETLNEA